MNNEIKSLTKEEQLRWYIEFLKDEIEKYQKELEQAQKALTLEISLNSK